MSVSVIVGPGESEWTWEWIELFEGKIVKDCWKVIDKKVYPLRQGILVSD
jgi:hypothetical protein